MEHIEDIELHELATIETNLQVEAPHEADPQVGDVVTAESGFMIASASGFMIA